LKIDIAGAGCVVDVPPNKLLLVLDPIVEAPKVFVGGAEVVAAGAEPNRPPLAGAVVVVVVVVLPKSEGAAQALVVVAGLPKLKGVEVEGALVILPKSEGVEDVVEVGLEPPNRLGWLGAWDLEVDASKMDFLFSVEAPVLTLRPEKSPPPEDEPAAEEL
jgi:hypothetical protein